MNISKDEQRTLHVLAQGGHIQIEKNDRGQIISALCFTREGWVLSNFSVPLFKRLKARKLIASQDSMPYRITRGGLLAVRAQLDNRG